MNTAAVIVRAKTTPLAYGFSFLCHVPGSRLAWVSDHSILTFGELLFTIFCNSSAITHSDQPSQEFLYFLQAHQPLLSIVFSITHSYWGVVILVGRWLCWQSTFLHSESPVCHSKGWLGRIILSFLWDDYNLPLFAFLIAFWGGTLSGDFAPPLHFLVCQWGTR